MNAHLALQFVLSGALVAGYAVAALFFLRFWRDTRDQLFVLFAAAFGLLSLQRIALAWAAITERDTMIYYILRLAAFLLILVAIINKNRASKHVGVKKL
jgi:hypothetical protein